MERPKLSAEQKKLLDRDLRVVESGPGAGKTLALVERFLASAEVSSKGVALISFTNAAVDEVCRRTSASSHLLRAPHFVGTIDSFLHRFVVSPTEAVRLRKMPTYYASWDDLPETLSILRAQGESGVGVRLSAFRMSADGSSFALNPEALRSEETAYLAKVTNAGKRGALDNQATSRIASLTSKGIYDAHTARLKAASVLSGPGGSDHVARLALRFGEMLVDEAQDCDSAEIEIIGLLSKAGVVTLVVADPDQAIFEFRGSHPDVFIKYRDSHQTAERASLTTNFRSSSAICSAISALRIAGNAPILPHVEGACAPVYVLSGDVDQQRDKFTTLLAERSISGEDAIVLSHARSNAEDVAGRKSVGQATTRALGNRLALACSLLRRAGSTPQERLEAVRAIERIVVGLIEWPSDLHLESREAQLADIERHPEWLREVAATLVSATASASSRESFITIARAHLELTLKPLKRTHASLSARVKVPTEDVWLACGTTPADSDKFRCSTIHGAKGMEFDAVLVALPKTLRKLNGKTVLDDWADGGNTEARRVLYVGASRARFVLAFGVGNHASRVAELLKASGTPHELR